MAVDIYFWRQFLILCASLVSNISIGIAIAFPSVLNPAITSINNTDIKTTGDHASWITSISGIGGLVGSFVMAPLMQILGRKACFISINVICLIGWVIFPFARNITALYVARFIQGIVFLGMFFSIFIVSEYVHPRRRGYFITLHKVAVTIGVMCCHATSTSLTWRNMSIYAGVIAFIAILLAMFWPESPQYLAFKGKFAECETTFEWLNGNSEESQKHLKALIDSQRERIAKNEIDNSLVNTARKFLKKDFLKAFQITVLLYACFELFGRHYYMVYIIQIMAELMDNKTSALYFTVGVDLLLLIAVFISTVIINYAKRRTIYFSTGVLCVLLMFLISILAYLKSVYTFSTLLQWFTALMIILQSFIVHVGVVPLTGTIKGEIFPLEHRGLGIFASCFVSSIIFAVILNIVPVLMQRTKLYGTYGIFGMALVVCLIILYKILPETKDKTLQEIEDELNGIIRTDIAVMERENLMN